MDPNKDILEEALKQEDYVVNQEDDVEVNGLDVVRQAVKDNIHVNDEVHVSEGKIIGLEHNVPIG